MSINIMTFQVTANLYIGPQIYFHLAKVSDLYKKGPILCSEHSAFCIRRVPFMSPKVSVLKKMWSFFLSKSQCKGVSFNFGERSYILPFADEWRDRKCPAGLSSQGLSRIHAWEWGCTA